MEKGKNVEVKTTEESLRMKLRRLKQEIREMEERGIEVELATAVVQAKSAALDAELAAKMTRSKGPTDSFPNQSSQKGEAAMGDNNEEIDLTDVVVAQPVLADQNELILQLIQKISEMRVDILQAPLPSPNANHQTGLPPQSQNVNRSHISLHHQNQHTNPQTFPRNYQATQNAQSPSIAPPLPQKATFQIPVPNEHDAHGSELDRYEEREREWRSKEETAKIEMKEEIRKAMKVLNCIPEVAGLSYEDLCIHPN
uniref:Uncharacterized protein n=1 Tax=Solanum tuberosum TaxID=4113 RepID=M1DAN7_SOLTU